MLILKIGACTLAMFLIGGLWYSDLLFGKTWRAEAGVPEEGGRHPGITFGAAGLASIVSAAILSFFWVEHYNLADSAFKGALIGIGAVACSLGINYAFANRSLKLWAIDGGYHVVQFAVWGAIIGLLSGRAG